MDTHSLSVVRADTALVNWVVFGSLVVVFLSYIFLLAIDPATAVAIASEDAPIEGVGAVILLMAFWLFLLCFVLSVATPNRFLGLSTRRNLWFLALALLMFLCFGEEISWGQRLFGWHTPEGLRGLNAQGETNIHNLWLFQSTNPDGSVKSSLALLLNANRLLSIFWLSYCVLVPLMAVTSVRLSQLTKWAGVPLPTLAVGGIFVANYLTFRLIVAFAEVDRETLEAFDELKETNYEFAFLVLAFSLLSALPQFSARLRRA